MIYCLPLQTCCVDFSSVILGGCVMFPRIPSVKKPACTMSPKETLDWMEFSIRYFLPRKLCVPSVQACQALSQQTSQFFANLLLIKLSKLTRLPFVLHHTILPFFPSLRGTHFPSNPTLPLIISPSPPGLTALNLLTYLTIPSNHLFFRPQSPGRSWLKWIRPVPSALMTPAMISSVPSHPSFHPGGN